MAGHAPFADELDRLLAADDVFAHDLVEGELQVGDLGGRHRMLAAYAEITRARTVPHAEVLELIRHRRLRGSGIGWIDGHLLASALVERCRLWTADARLAEVARRLRTAH